MYQYVLGAVFGIFMAQYIYQMHGLFEMHFIAFIGSAMLITYQKWKLQIPLAVVVVLHHASFAYMQYAGYDKVYFTQLDFMSLQTFIIHVILASLIFFICGLWAYQFQAYSKTHIEQSFEIGKLQEEQLKKEALLQGERQFYEFFESAPEAIIVQDMDTGKLVDVNANAVKMFGFSKDQMLGKALFEMSPDKQPDEIISEEKAATTIAKAMAGEKAIFEWEYRDANNVPLITETRLTKLSIPGRNLLRSSIIDISDKKIAEAEIIALNESLEAKVKDRTEQLEVVNRELEAFCYSVSHDLRAPLRIINGFSKMIMQKEAANMNQAIRENMDIIMKNATHMGQLIDDLLDFCRLGRSDLTVKATDMNDMVKTVIDEVQSDNQVTLPEFQLHELYKVKCDPTLMKQVWTNLISNAVKYSRKKEKPVIEIGTTHCNGSTTFFVKDNGAGFDMKFSDKLFAVFQRLHKVTEYEGTGVGLALVHRIIAKHNGKIWADAKINEGATFYFTLPNY